MPLPRKNLNISGELHSFLKQRAAEPKNIMLKQGISDLGEKAIRFYFGIDENGKSLMNPPAHIAGQKQLEAQKK